MSKPIVDIVIKSYPADYCWLAYLLKSIAKYARGFNQVLVLLPRSAPLNLTLERTVYLDQPEGYLAQQVAKLNADYHSKADYILHLDSDMVLTRPVTPDYFFRNGKPIWVMEDFDKESKAVWYHVMAKALQECPPYEFMRKCAILVPRWMYAEFRAFIQATHGMTMDAYVMAQPKCEFTEYNCLGFYAWLKHREKFDWLNIGEEGCPEWPWVQNWSWGGMSPSLKAELERITA